MKSIAYVGLDVHKGFIVSSSYAGSDTEPFDERKVPNEEASVRKHFRKLAGRYDLRCCYEASGCGYVLYRWLTELGIHCDVIAPSKIPVRPGDRIKTDQRDARKLARLYRSGELTVVRPPDPEDESVRALVRCRETMVREVVRSKNQVLKFLRLKGFVWRGGSNWTQKHLAWLRSLPVDGVDALVLAEYMALLDYKSGRLKELDEQVAKIASSPCYQERVGKLCCLRGVSVQTAMVLISEVIDFARFASARNLMGYLGLVPGEQSSSDKRILLPITKAGNARCRRVLVEAAWHYRHQAGVSPALKKRQQGQPAAVVAHAMKAQHRLHKKFWRVAARRERPRAVVAVARELAGFVWAIMTDQTGAQTNAGAHA